jgi:hypothetical protein
VDDDGGFESSNDESSDDGGAYQRPMATDQSAEQMLSPLNPFDFGIDPYNDGVDVDVDNDGMLAQIKLMP